MPLVDIYRFYSPGDTGRDVYAFQMAFEGKLPCRDYWWQYGPLMPFYYAFWFLLTGVNLLSVRIGLDVLLFLCAFLSYMTLRIFVYPSIAFLFSLSFLSFYAGYTLNHIGCFPFLILSVFSLWKFFLTHRTRWCYVGIFAVIGTALVKTTAGIASLFAFLASLLLYNLLSKQKDPNGRFPLDPIHLLYVFLIFSAVTFGVYGFLYFGLPLSWVDQCLWLRPYYRNWGILPFGISNIDSFSYLLHGRHLLWHSLFVVVSAFGLWSLRKKNSLLLEGQTLSAVVGSPLLFGLSNAMDYFADGMAFRIHFWAFPMQVLLMGLFGGWATSAFTSKTRAVFLGGVFFSLLLIPLRNLQVTLPYRTPERYLDLPHGHVYLGGALSVLESVREGSRFILENTTEGQQILAVPYDALFCFLSGRRQAIRELHFYNETPISERRQREIVAQLETKRVPLIILAQVGSLGRNHHSGFLGKNCEKLHRYIFRHYEKVRTFGTLMADSPSTYPIVILKRKYEQAG